MAFMLNADGDRVLVSCTCSALSPLTRLYFCRHCIKLRCQLCVSHEVDSYYCPNCLENMPSAEAKLKKNRCANCFDCPSCSNTLSTRATAVAIPSDDNKTPQAKKVYYLACGFCRWSSRDVDMADRTVASGGWPDPENPAAKRIGDLVDYYRQLAQKEKVEREKKKMSKRRNYMHLAYTPKRKDRLGMSSLSRRKSSLSYLTAQLGKGKEIEFEDIVLKDPSQATEDVEILPEEFYTKPLVLEQIPHITQRLSNPDVQPTDIKSLHTRHKHLLAKRSQRCRECEHNLSKPEFNPSSIKFKIQLGSFYYVPRIRIANLPPMKDNEEVQVMLSMTNPVESIVKVTLHPFEEDEEKKEEDAKTTDTSQTTTEEENKENEKNAENKNEEKKPEKIEDQKEKENGEEKNDNHSSEEKKEQKEESENKGANEKAEKKEEKGKTDSLVASALYDRKTERRVNNSCDSRAFVSTAEVVLPTCTLALGARDEAAEFDDTDTTAELFSDDPRVIADRQCNKLWFYVKVTPKKPVGDVKFSMIMQYDYKHTSPLVRGKEEPETRIETQRHKIHINLGPLEVGSEV